MLGGARLYRLRLLRTSPLFRGLQNSFFKAIQLALRYPKDRRTRGETVSSRPSVPSPSQASIPSIPRRSPMKALQNRVISGSAILIVVVGAVSTLLPSCATESPVGHTSQSTAPTFQVDAKAEAVTGAWVRTEDADNGDRMLHTLLFGPDGTGVTRFEFTKFSTGAFTPDTSNFMMDWTYAGRGIWNVRMHPTNGIGPRDLVYKLAVDSNGRERLFCENGVHLVEYKRREDA